MLNSYVDRVVFKEHVLKLYLSLLNTADGDTLPAVLNCHCVLETHVCTREAW